MNQKSYFPLDNEANVLALLQKGYSFIKVGGTVIARPNEQDLNHNGPAALTEGIPSKAPADDSEHVILSKFLQGAPPAELHVDSRYFI